MFQIHSKIYGSNLDIQNCSHCVTIYMEAFIMIKKYLFTTISLVLLSLFAFAGCDNDNMQHGFYE